MLKSILGTICKVSLSTSPTINNSRNNLYVPRPRLSLFKTSISFAGASLWNSLPQNIKSCISCNLAILVSNIIFTNVFLRITFHQTWMDLFWSHVCLKMWVLYTYRYVNETLKFYSDACAHLYEHCVTALINCLFMLIVWLSGFTLTGNFQYFTG